MTLWVQPKCRFCRCLWPFAAARAELRDRSGGTRQGLRMENSSRRGWGFIKQSRATGTARESQSLSSSARRLRPQSAAQAVGGEELKLSPQKPSPALGTARTTTLIRAGQNPGSVPPQRFLKHKTPNQLCHFPAVRCWQRAGLSQSIPGTPG